jgi:hypothetical protein
LVGPVLFVLSTTWVKFIGPLKLLFFLVPTFAKIDHIGRSFFVSKIRGGKMKRYKLKVYKETDVYLTNAYLNEKKVAKMLNLSVSTLRMDRHYNKGLPYYKIGKSVRYNINDVKNYLDTKRINTREKI